MDSKYWHYTDEIRQTEPISESKVQETGVKTAPAVRPWARFFARFIDYTIGGILIEIWFAIVAPSILIFFDRAFNLLILFIWVFLEASLLSIWGTTPGKWLLNITLTDKVGNKPTFSNALDRSFSVWWRGYGMGLPLISLITLFFTYNTLNNRGITRWDSDGGFLVSHKEIDPLRTILIVLFIIGLILLTVYSN